MLKVRVNDFQRIRDLFDLYDLDGDGLLSYREFSQFVCPRHKDYWKLLKKREPQDFEEIISFEKVREFLTFFRFIRRKLKGKCMMCFTICWRGLD
jgi:Ca2+-binding EF-hand superfamily protein